MLRGPSFLNGLDGSGGAEIRHDSRFPDGQSVWVTFGRRSAVRYDLEEMCVKFVLSLPLHVELSTPVVYCPEIQRDVCVLNKNLLIDFDSTETGFNLEKAMEKGRSVGDNAKAVDVQSGLGQEWFILFEDGQVQSLSYLRKHTISSLAKTTRSSAYKTSKAHYFLWKFKGQLLLTHVALKSKPQVKVQRIKVDPESLECKLSPLGDTEFPSDLKCVAQLEKGLVAIDKDGQMWHQSLLTSTGEWGPSGRSKMTLETPNVSLQSANYVCKFTGDKVAVLGPKEGSEGQAVVVIDVGVGRDGFGVGGMGVKAVQSEGKLLLCHGKRIFFQHGQRMAAIFVDNLPSTLADFVGKKAFEKGSTEDPAEEPWQPLDMPSQPLELYKILPDLLRKESNFDDIETVLQSFTDIPELLVLNFIEMLLSSSSESRQKDLLSKAFRIPVTDTVLLQHLRMTEFKMVEKMLQHLLALLQIETTTEASDVGDSFEHYLAWISCILNAHYGNFLLSGDATLLEDALETVQVLESCVNSMGETMAVLKMIQDNQMIQPDYSNKPYSIELVDL